MKMLVHIIDAKPQSISFMVFTTQLRIEVLPCANFGMHPYTGVKTWGVLLNKIFHWYFSIFSHSKLYHSVKQRFLLAA